MILAHRPGSGLDPAQSATINQIWAVFAQYDLGCLWMIATKSESGKVVAGWLHPARNWA